MHINFHLCLCDTPAKVDPEKAPRPVVPGVAPRRVGGWFPHAARSGQGKASVVHPCRRQRPRAVRRIFHAARSSRGVCLLTRGHARKVGRRDRAQVPQRDLRAVASRREPLQQAVPTLFNTSHPGLAAALRRDSDLDTIVGGRGPAKGGPGAAAIGFVAGSVGRGSGRSADLALDGHRRRGSARAGAIVPPGIPVDALRFWEDSLARLVKSDAWKRAL